MQTIVFENLRKRIYDITESNYTQLYAGLRKGKIILSNYRNNRMDNVHYLNVAKDEVYQQKNLTAYQKHVLEAKQRVMIR